MLENDIILPFPRRNRSEWRSGASKRFVKSDKHDFVGVNAQVPHTNPLGRRNTTLLCCFIFFKSPMLVGKREREGEGEGEGKSEGLGERMEVGGGVEMNGSGGFIGCCQGG